MHRGSPSYHQKLESYVETKVFYGRLFDGGNKCYRKRIPRCCGIHMRFSPRAGVAEMGQSRQKWTDRRGTKDVSRTDASNCSCSFGDVLQEGRGKPEKVDVVLRKSQSTRILREGVVGLFRSLGSCISCSTGR